PLFSFRRSTMSRRVAVLVWAMVLASAATAADAPPGATSCSGCHPATSGVDTPVPPLAGRNPADLLRQMQAFRSGEGKTTVMDKIARGFSDEEIQAIAAWYAEQRGGGEHARHDAPPCPGFRRCGVAVPAARAGAGGAACGRGGRRVCRRHRGAHAEK